LAVGNCLLTNFGLLEIVFFENCCPKMQIWGWKPAFWANLGAKLKFWAPIISFVGNLQLSVGILLEIWIVCWKIASLCPVSSAQHRCCLGVCCCNFVPCFKRTTTLLLGSLLLQLCALFQAHDTAVAWEFVVAVCFRVAVSAITTYVCVMAAWFRAHTCCRHRDRACTAAGLQSRCRCTRHCTSSHKTSYQTCLCTSSVVLHCLIAVSFYSFTVHFDTQASDIAGLKKTFLKKAQFFFLKSPCKPVGFTGFGYFWVKLEFFLKGPTWWALLGRYSPLQINISYCSFFGNFITRTIQILVSALITILLTIIKYFICGTKTIELNFLVGFSVWFWVSQPVMLSRT